MSQIIIHPRLDDATKIVIMLPCLDCGLTIEQIAAKDVPPNIPYFIIDSSLLPSDLSLSDAWEVDFSDPDGIGSNYGVGSQNAVVGYKPDGTPIIRRESVLQ